jgi:cbb3-type cytochrome oxidase subunit 3
MRLSDIMGHSGLAAYAEIGLVLFLIAFAAIVVRTMWPSRRGELDRASRLPLENGDASPKGNEESHDE